MRIADFELERYFAQWEFAAPHLLCTSDVEGWRMGDVLAMADGETAALWEGLMLGYTESPGHPALRAEIASLYERVQPDEVMTFAGAEEAIFTLSNVLLGPGDHAVVTWPGYQSLYEVARATGAEVTLLELRHEEGWALDPERLRAAVRPSTRLIVLNVPHNPTGALPGAAAFAAAVEVAADAGAVLFSDEVYRLLERDPADRLPAGVDLAPTGVSLGVMSKAFGMAGLRVGWLATRDRALLARCAAFKDYLSICNAAPSEVLALVALRARERVLARSREIVSTNFELAVGFFERQADTFEWVEPRAGSIAFPRLRAPMAVEEFCERLVREEGVLLLPGTVYGHAGNHFRIGLGRTSFREGLERLERFAERELVG